MLAKMYEVTAPFRWGKRDYGIGDLIEIRLRSHTRHPTLAGKLRPHGIDSTRARAMKAEASSQAAASG